MMEKRFKKKLVFFLVTQLGLGLLTIALHRLGHPSTFGVLAMGLHLILYLVGLRRMEE